LTDEIRALLRETRVMRGVSQAQVADAITARGHEVSRSALAAWETGSRPLPQWRILCAWASALDVTLVVGGASRD